MGHPVMAFLVSMVVHFMEAIGERASMNDLLQDRLNRLRAGFFGIRTNCFFVRVFERAVCVSVMFLIRRLSLNRYLVNR